MLHGRELVAAGNQYDWQGWSQIPDYLLKCKSVSAVHADVG
jgi:hypothetical protein